MKLSGCVCCGMTIAGLALSGCSSNDSAGATTETTNGIAVTVVDSLSHPVVAARVALYDTAANAVATGTSDSSGRVFLNKGASSGAFFVETLLGSDSSLMSWDSLKTDTAEIKLLPSASLIIRSGAAVSDSSLLPSALRLKNTPYRAALAKTEYRFAHLPAGAFRVQNETGDSLGSVKITPAETLDTLFTIGSVLRTLLFEDFEDGNGKYVWADSTGSSGWYVNSENGGAWLSPLSSDSIPLSIVSGDAYEGSKAIALRFSLGDSGSVSLGTHLGADSLHYDLSSLSAIRIAVRGDVSFSLALEYYKDLATNKYNKATWSASAASSWREIVFHPGEEDPLGSAYTVPWADVSTGIALFTIFIRGGTSLDIDYIIFEGVDKNVFYAPLTASAE